MSAFLRAVLRWGSAFLPRTGVDVVARFGERLGQVAADAGADADHEDRLPIVIVGQNGRRKAGQGQDDQQERSVHRCISRLRND